MKTRVGRALQKRFSKPANIEEILLLHKWFGIILAIEAVAVLVGMFCLFFGGCASLEKKLSAAAAPYSIYDAQIAEQDFAGIEFTFANLSGKEISSVKFFARISGGSYNEDFLQDEADAMQKEFVYAAALNAGDAESIFIPFEEFIFEEELENYFAESLYATEIVFSDGTVWQDSGGGAML